jgi:hypothetical protein
MFRIYVPPVTEGEVPEEIAEGAVTRYTLPAIPDAVLQRHGARVLRPSQAAVVEGQTRPDPTVYRYGVLLMPRDMADVGFISEFNHELAEVGMRLVPPREGVLDYPGPVAVQLAPTGFKAESVDAWTALQRLRAGAGPEDAPAQLRLARITLDHLLVGSALDGAGSAMLFGTNTASNGSPDLSDLFSRPAAGTSGRIPVTVVLPDPPPPRTAAKARRRPVVAVLDTGIADEPEHPWLTPRAERGSAGAKDAVVLVDSPLQTEIQQLAASGSGIPRLPIVGYADRPSIEEPLLGDLSTHAGHGTFIAGIIRQLAPDAQIYAVRVMHPDGFAHEADVVHALGRIADLVELAHATTGQQGQYVDVVSLSLGYFHESPDEVRVTDQLQPIIDRLLTLGVAVVAAAGNFSTSRRFYPGALTTRLTGPDRAPLISVGALNPNGTTSRFSDEGPWVTCFASGAAVVSTFPKFAGALNPPFGIGRRQSFDPDDFRGMFGLWSGSSFATPGIAGALAAELTPDAGTLDGAGQERLRTDAAHQAWTEVLKKFTITEYE